MHMGELFHFKWLDYALCASKTQCSFRFDEKQSHYFDCFLVTCGAKLLGI